MNPARLNRAEALAALPPDWPHALLPDIRRHIDASNRSLVVLDDDPTGTQTVHDVAVLTTWDVDALAVELRRKPAVFYILTNSRSLPLAQAQSLNQEIGQNLRAAAHQSGREIAVVSRSDSTLRGHYPGEVDALAQALQGDEQTTGKRGFDGDLIIPYFLEGGRLTIDDVHYVAEGEELIPAAETPFAQDAAFGYRSSYLPDWVAEKTGGQVPASRVASIPLAVLRQEGPDAVAARLEQLTHRQPCVVNAVSLRDMEVFVVGLLQAEAAGKRFLYRTAASFVQIRAGLETRPLLTAADLAVTPGAGALFVVGSYVPKTTAQVQVLLAMPGIRAVEVEVAALLDDARQDDAIAQATATADAGLAAGEIVVIYTSRELVTGTEWLIRHGKDIAGAARRGKDGDAEAGLVIGQRVSASLVQIVRGLQQRPGYLVGKGGITASDIATRALNIRRAVVAGQILPGVPVWQTGDESRFPGLPYVVFPGNVGDDQALATIVKHLR